MWKPQYDGDFPTLGYQVIDWMHDNLAAPDRTDGEPLVLYSEQEEFILRFYEIDLEQSRRKIRRGVISRPKGWGKSPMLAAIAAAEALGPVVFDGWDSEGQPVGKPWREIRTPLVQLSAVSEDQTRNAWAPLLEMIREGYVLDNYPGIEPMETFVNLPGKGRIEFVTASARSREGNRPVFCVLDQTETWLPSNGGVNLAATMRRNLGKTGGASIESPNAYLPGESSVAEASAQYWQTICDGKAIDEGLHYDHREAQPDTELPDRDSLLKGLRYAYGDAARDVGGHVDLERIVSEIYDPATDPQDARRYYLNQITHASDSFVSQPEWAGLREPQPVEDGELITLGFDGSRGRAKGKPDATALIGCTIEGYVFEIGVWESPDGPEMDQWQPPLAEIDAAVADAFDRYQVAAFYADPAKDWRSKVNEWEAAFSTNVPVKVTRDHPFEWWMTGGRSIYIERAVEAFEAAVRNKELRHDGSFRLTQHVLNTRRRVARQRLTLGKAHDYSPHKIDACVAAVLAWQARMDAVAAGVRPRPKRKAPVRVR
jgi:hypothetical protein